MGGSGANTRVDRVTAVAEPRPVPLPLRAGLLLPLRLPLLVPPMPLPLALLAAPPLPLDSRASAEGIIEGTDVGAEARAAASMGVEGEGARVMAGDRLASLPAPSFSFPFNFALL